MTSTHHVTLDQLLDDEYQPQPLPPKLLGELVGREVLRVAWLAHQLGLPTPTLQFCEEVCPPWPQAPVVPTHVWGFPLPAPDRRWLQQYHRGMARTLGQAQGWQADSPVVRDALRRCTEALEQSL